MWQHIMIYILYRFVYGFKMLSLDNFRVVFEFILHRVDDPYYSNKVDQHVSLENEQSIYYKRMVRYVKEFHEIRRKSCQRVMEAYNCFDLGMMLMNAMQVQVHHMVPKNGVECYLDKQTITDGITMIIDKKNMLCVSKRYEKILYTIYLLMHMPDQIAKEYMEYKAISYNNSIPHFIQESHERRLKFYYIKLKTMLEYIETNI